MNRRSDEPTNEEVSAGDTFLIVSHPAPNLKPGLPEKLASITSELSIMYPNR
jgi:hypothetical protein